jgi:hypothetical protein
MATIAEQIEILKPLVNYEFDVRVKETLDYPFDFINSISESVRSICKETNTFKKTILIPLCKGITDYKIDLSRYTKDVIEYVKPFNYALMVLDTDASTGQGIKTLVERNIEDINLLTEKDINGLGLRQMGKDLYLKTNFLIETPLEGLFDKITSISTSTLELNNGTGVGVGTYIYNLDKSDLALIDYAKVTAGASNPYTISPDKIDVDGLLHWNVDDKVYCNSSGKVVFLLFSFTALPTTAYFSATSTVIPIPDADIDDVKDLAVAKLYEILISRFPDMSNAYGVKLKLGLVKQPDKVISNIRRRINTTAQPNKIKTYNILGDNDYGR